MENIWRKIGTDELREAFLLLGVDERYISGRASDFESFCMLCACVKYLAGNCAADAAAEKISALLGRPIALRSLADADTSHLWRECNEILNGMCFACGENYNITSTVPAPSICDEKSNILSHATDLNSFLSACVSENISSLAEVSKKLENTENNALFVKFEQGGFVRPNEYSSSIEYRKILLGEKYNLNLILSQLVLNTIYDNKCQKTQLVFDIETDTEYVFELVKYISCRSLRARIYIFAHVGISPTDIKKYVF